MVEILLHEKEKVTERGISTIQVILLFGLISLIADAVYEGARGIIPNYLEVLGASAFLVGVVLGISEFIGYLFRVVSGTLTDKWQNPWPFVLTGYGVLIVIPLLALAGHWMLALLLLIVERLGKSIRGPARDFILSTSTKKEVAGKVFGLHELMDQTGAILGPLIAMLILYLTASNYQLAFLGFLFPYSLLVIVLLLTYSILRDHVKSVIKKETSTNELKMEKLENLTKNQVDRERMPLSFRYYSMAIFLNMVGLVHFSILLLIANESVREIAWLVPAFYLLIQAIDALLAPIWGILFDKIRHRILIIPFALAVLPSIFLMDPTTLNVVFASVSFGIVLAAQESIYRAGVPHIIPTRKRGTAFGYLYLMMGLGSLLSGAVFGYFLEKRLFPLMAIFSFTMQVPAILLAWQVKRTMASVTNTHR